MNHCYRFVSNELSSVLIFIALSEARFNGQHSALGIRHFPDGISSCQNTHTAILSVTLQHFSLQINDNYTFHGYIFEIHCIKHNVTSYCKFGLDNFDIASGPLGSFIVMNNYCASFATNE